MRRILIPAAAFALLAAPACKRVHHPNPNATIEEESELSPSIRISDARDAAQLLSGFHSLEQNAWRWTAGQFSVSLAVPNPAAQGPGRLEFRFTVPDVVAADLAGLTVSAAVEGRSLGSWQAARTGEQTAVFSVPPGILRADALIVDFTLNKTVPRRDGETRDLGVIALGFRLVRP